MKLALACVYLFRAILFQIERSREVVSTAIKNLDRHSENSRSIDDLSKDASSSLFSRIASIIDELYSQWRIFPARRYGESWRIAYYQPDYYQSGYTISASVYHLIHVGANASILPAHDLLLIAIKSSWNARNKRAGAD